MTIVRKCFECGSVLAKGDPGLKDNDIRKRFDGKCPECGRKLGAIVSEKEHTPITYGDVVAGRATLEECIKDCYKRNKNTQCTREKVAQPLCDGCPKRNA